MNDDVKAANEALVESMVRQLRGCVSVGDEMTLDHACLIDDAEAWIAGEPARTAAAVAAAREEQREADAKFCPNCLGVGFVERPVPCPYCDDSTHDHYCPTGTQRQQCGCGAERIRATPLTATPLADELERSWQTTARMIERAEKAESEVEREKTEHAEALTRLDAWRMRAGTAEAERDALRVEKEQEWREHLAEKAAFVSEVASLRAQVEAARAFVARNAEPVEDDDSWSAGYADALDDLLAAMDGAKP